MLRAVRRGGKTTCRFWLKKCNKKILLGWERAREHMMATQKHNPIYLEWCIKFGALGGGNKGRIEATEAKEWMKMKEESHIGEPVNRRK